MARNPKTTPAAHPNPPIAAAPERPRPLGARFAQGATPTPPPDPSAPRDAVALSALGLAVLAAGTYVFWDYTVDDAFISLRYAKNLLVHGQLTLNPGERPVEGFSNLLFTLLLVPATALAEPIGVARVYGLIAGAASLWLLLRIAREVVPEERRLAPLSWCLCAATPGWVYWHTAGLETPLFGALLLLGIYLQLRDDRKRAQTAWVAWSALMLTRIDGFVIALPAIVLSWLLRPTRRELARTLTTLTFALLPVAASFAFRLAYYGDLLPNTFYAKVSTVTTDPAAGLVYLIEPLRQAPALGVAFLAPLWAYRRRNLAERMAAYLSLLFIIQCAYVVRIGGDWMPLYRLIAPVVPLAALTVALTLLRSLRAASQNGEGLATLVPVVLAAVVPAIGYGTYWMTDSSLAVMQTDLTAKIGRHLGQHLGETYPPGTRVALGAAGSSAFYSDLAVIDMGGLGDRHIAHSRAAPGASSVMSAGHIKGDGYYVLAERPDIIVFLAGRSETPGTYATDTQIAFHPRFHADYERHRVVLPRPRRQVGVYGGLPEPAERLIWFGALQAEPGPFGLELWQLPAVEVFYYRHVPTERSPAEAALAEVATAFEGKSFDRALQLLEAARPVLTSGGLGWLADPIAARLQMARRDMDAAAAHLMLSEARLEEPWRRLLRAWVHLDPAFEPLLEEPAAMD